MSRQGFQDCRVWITGASAGIGEALALELARRGARIALSARRRDALESVAARIDGDRCLVLPLDVTDREANHETVAAIETQWGGVDLVVLNAGTAEYVDADHFDAGVFRRVFEINYMGMVYGIEAALPALRRSPRPHLVGMSSSAAWGGLPRAEAYGASKAAIRNMMQALAIHLRPRGIAVSVVCPGFVRTPLTDRNDFPMPMRIEPAVAARRIVDGIARRKVEIHFPKPFTLPLKLLSMLPAGIYTRLMASTVRSA